MDDMRPDYEPNISQRFQVNESGYTESCKNSGVKKSAIHTQESSHLIKQIILITKADIAVGKSNPKISTLGILKVKTNCDIICDIHIVRDSLSTNVAGLVGCNVLSKYSESTNAS
ncbi:hypothetical protein TSAR_014797 [Trichomalopsis sarcophagae]|uniref:Uncharacterized protein n=1 Tax=Trichomalopsis sarcophagae TaxID=543379 RepID=A0A232ESR6_9HYME|nr:hypothetical protein TSAR_014797 [Trichomalopsis sarcophagae]